MQVWRSSGEGIPLGFLALAITNLKANRACLRLCAGRQQQFPPTEKQIDQRASDKQPVRVLLQSSVAQLHKSELQLHHLGASKLIEMWVHSLWGKSPLLFDRIPVAHIFDGCAAVSAHKWFFRTLGHEVHSGTRGSSRNSFSYKYIEHAQAQMTAGRNPRD